MRSSALLDTVVSPKQAAALRAGTIVTIGNFDGVHRGHQAIIESIRKAARARNAKAVALTFEPHPTTLFQDRAADTFRLTTSDYRATLLRRYGIDVVVTIPFTQAFSDLHARDFVRGLLCARLHAKEVHIGYDFAFGRGREGTASRLQTLCGALGIDVVIHEAYQRGDATISSTRVRDALKRHALEDVTALFGRPWTVPGIQTSGAQRGREMGIPTINLYPENVLMPPFGIYVSHLRTGGKRWSAVTSIGTRPTFEDDDRVSIETYVLDPDFKGTPYGAELEVELLSWIREELAFESQNALQVEMERDIAKARAYHADH